MENRNFVDNMMDLLDQVEKQSPSKDFVEKMQKETRVRYGKPKVIRFNMLSIMGIAVSFLLLLMVNIYAINNSNQGKTYVNKISESTYNLLAIQTLYDE